MRACLIPILFLLFTTAGCTAQTKQPILPSAQPSPTVTPSPQRSETNSDAKNNSLSEDQKLHEQELRDAGRDATAKERQARKLIERGEFAKATELLRNTLYTDRYINSKEIGALFLRSAHKFALETNRKGNAEKAYTLMEDALKYPTDYAKLQPTQTDAILTAPRFILTEEEYKKAGLESYLSWNEYVEIVNDYGFFLEQADGTGYDVEVLQQVVKMSPQREAAHLNLADALWKHGNKQEAAAEYKEYVNLMTAKGLAGNLPSRVKTRLP